MLSPHTCPATLFRETMSQLVTKGLPEIQHA